MGEEDILFEAQDRKEIEELEMIPIRSGEKGLNAGHPSA